MWWYTLPVDRSGRGKILFSLLLVENTGNEVKEMNSDTQERQSVYDYFLEKYNIKLKYPNLPTVGKIFVFFFYLK